MSSGNYGDKSLEEVRLLVEKYCENYRKLFGVEPDLSKLSERIEALKLKKEDEVFARMFGQMTPRNLADCCQVINIERSPKAQVAAMTAAIPIKSKNNKKG